MKSKILKKLSSLLVKLGICKKYLLTKISDPEPLEQNVDISHLSEYEKNLFLPLKEN